MKIPCKPPEIEEISCRLSSERLQELLCVSRENLPDDRYLHWDKLRRHPPPAGWSHEEWWFALKMRRRVMWEEIPLRDERGQPFRYGTPPTVLEHLHWLDQNAAGRIEVAEPHLINPETRDRYFISSLVEEAITSSQLEGAATTRRVAREMIRTGRKPRDIAERMILNNYRAMQEIRRFIREDLTKDLILELHRILMKDTLDTPSAIGRFRLPGEEVKVVTPDNLVLHIPPPAEQVEERMRLLCDFANGKIPERRFLHPVVRSILLHFWLAYDHPFCDGNGRCARAVFYWSMLRQGYWLTEFLSISRILRKSPVRYGRAFLYTETDENDLTYFLLHHLRVIRKAVEELQDFIRRKEEEVRRVEREVRLSPLLNPRQKALLGHALRHPDAVYTIHSHQVSHGVVYQTARSDLLEMVSHGLLVQQKAGRRFVFRPAGHLTKRFGRSG